MLILGAPVVSKAATVEVIMRDNVFTPQELHIDPGDKVVWRNGGRNIHDVASDIEGQFRSGDISRGGTFSHTFTEEGYYYYHCANHGGANQEGMWGLVIVGNPPPPGTGGPKDPRPTLRVPKDFKTIQKAVNRAKSGTKILVSPGVYNESVLVVTKNLSIVGVDRFRTVLHGKDQNEIGFHIAGAPGVTIKNLTVRNFTDTGVFFDSTNRYAAVRVDSIKNRSYGIRANDSFDGLIKDTFAWGSGSAGIAVTACADCSTLVDGVEAQRNFLGYWSENATGVVVRGSVFKRNGAGVISASLPDTDTLPNRGHLLLNNVVSNNNYGTIPAADLSEQYGIPFGTGIWLLGPRNNVVQQNTVRNNARFGIVVSRGADGGEAPMRNSVRENSVEGAGGYDLAWDGEGADNCFSANAFATSGPPDIQVLYGCDNRPFTGTTYEPVDSLATLGSPDPERSQVEPPMPTRPRCQRGAPGCDR
jgi:parallel beta-helix repeat protein